MTESVKLVKMCDKRYWCVVVKYDSKTNMGVLMDLRTFKRSKYHSGDVVAAVELRGPEGDML